MAATLPLYLRVLREQRGLRQGGLAILLGMPQPVLSMIETGRYVPSPKQLARIAEVLGVEHPELLLKPVQAPQVEEAALVP